jgi:hypothetical protein
VPEQEVCAGVGDTRLCLSKRASERDKNMVQETNGEARPATPDEPKKRSSNLMASAGVNFERRYRSNQSAQNYHVGQSEVSLSLSQPFFSVPTLTISESAKAVAAGHLSACLRIPPLIVARPGL